MKILVIGDTHGNITSAVKVIRRIKRRIDFIIHLGDNVSDAQDLSYEFEDIHFEYVAGNCDFSSYVDKEKILSVNGRRILVTHGHLYGVKSGIGSVYNHAVKNKCDVVLYGHTHIPQVVKYDDILIMSPGSMSLPRGKEGPSYGVLDITDEGQVEASIVEYKKKF